MSCWLQSKDSQNVSGRSSDLILLAREASGSWKYNKGPDVDIYVGMSDNREVLKKWSSR